MYVIGWMILKKAVEHLKENGVFMVTECFETSIEKGFLASHFFNQHWGLIEIIGRKV